MSAEAVFGPAWGRHHTAAGGTELDAARLLAPVSGRMRRLVYDLIVEAAERGLTDDEGGVLLSGVLGITDCRRRFAPRREELVRAGYVFDSGERRQSPAQRNVAVWKAAMYDTPPTAATLRPGHAAGPPSWSVQPILGFYLETTGFSADWARIVTACTLWVDQANGETVTRQWLADPQVPIPAKTTEVHGISTAFAKAHGRHSSEVVTEIVEAVERAGRERIPVVTFNAVFDLTLLDRECRRWLHRPLVIGPVIDPMCLDRLLDPNRAGKRTLTDCCAHYGVKAEDTHTAVGDAAAAARLAWKLPRVFPEIAAMSLAELHRHQSAWRVDWPLRPPKGSP